MTWLAKTVRLAAAILLAVVLLFGLVDRLLALATEHFGNEPLPPGGLISDNNLSAVANLPSRFYWYEVNGDPHFFFRGNTQALNEALRRFGGGAGEREVILLPGPQERQSLTRDKRFPYDWELHAPNGFYLHAAQAEKGTRVMTLHPTMTVYVTVVRPERPADAEQVKRWIAELDSDQFTVRDKAARELEALDNAVGPALRKALAASPSVEQRQRIERLLGRLDGIDLDQIRVPAGVTVLDWKDLFDRYVAGLKGDSYTIRGQAAGGLGTLARCTDEAIPILLDVLKKDKHEYVRRCTAGALSRLGTKAAAALPVLKEGLQDPDVNVRNAFRQAVDTIENAKPERGNDEQSKKQAAIQKRIHEFRMAQGK
jgi:hypothetical protein